MVHHGTEERGEEGGSEKAKADLLYPLRPAFPLGEKDKHRWEQEQIFTKEKKTFSHPV